MTSARVHVLALAIALLAMPPLAHGDEAKAFADATERMAAGDYASAAASLRAIAERAPEDPLADDSLFLAAKLYEERLAQPGSALQVYRALVERYPDSRSAMAAQRRVEVLAASVGQDGSGAAPLAEFQAILDGFSERGPEASLRRAEELLSRYPDWDQRHRVWLWRGSATRRMGDLRAAAQAFALAASEPAAPAEARFEALLGGAEVAILLDDYDEARRLHEQVASILPAPSPAQEELIDELDEHIERGHSRSLLYRFSHIVVGGSAFLLLATFVLLTRGATFRWAVLAPPKEVWFLLPLLALLVGMAATSHREIGPAVALIAVGGVVFAWLSGMVLRAPVQLRPLIAIYTACLGASGVLALCYIALHRSQLLDLILTTIEYGPE